MGGGLSLFPHTTKSEVQVVDLITFRHFEGEIYILEESERHCFYENDHCKFCDFGTKQRCSIWRDVQAYPNPTMENS